MGRALALLLAVMMVAGPAGAQERADMALGEKSAYMLLPARYAAGPAVRDAAWSSDGRFLLMSVVDIQLDARMVAQALSGGPSFRPPVAGASLAVWTAKDASTQVVWRAPSPDVSFDVNWLPGSTVALVLAHNVDVTPANAPANAPRDMRDVLLRIDGPTGSARVLGRADAMGSYTVAPSPSQPVAVVRRWSTVLRETVGSDGKPEVVSETHDSVSVVKADGGAGPTVSVPDGVRLLDASWVAKDKIGLRGVDAKRPAQGERASRCFVMDARTGALGPVAELPKPETAPKVELPFTLGHAPANLVAGAAKVPVRPVFLIGAAQGKETPGLVAADAEWAALSPTGSAVAYRSGESLCVRLIVEVPRAALEAAREAARRAVALSNAKQCGLAVMMYAQDHGEVLPGQGDDIGSLLTPYFQNPTPLDGFVYTFAGGALSGVQSPAETEMGYVTGPGGRAIVYVDGHAKWKPDKQP